MSAVTYPYQCIQSRKEQQERRRKYPLDRRTALPASAVEWHQNLSLRGLQNCSLASDDQNETTWCRMNKQSLMECALYLISSGMEWIGGGLVLVLFILPGSLLDRWIWAPIRRFWQVFIQQIPVPSSLQRFFVWLRRERYRVSTGQGREKYIYASGAALWAHRTMFASNNTTGGTNDKKRRRAIRRRRRSQRDPDWN